MKRIISLASLIFIITSLFYGCNIVPKSVQYQKEEEDLMGRTDNVNPRIEELQIVLGDLGYNTGNIDGRMSQKTREAIKEFQESRGLKSTGYINKIMLRQIDDIRRVYEEGELEQTYTVKVRSAYSQKEDGSQVGPDISARDIQIALKNAGFDPGVIDGKIGPRTKQAIKEFQKTKGLLPDGKVGPKTWAELGKHLSE